MELKWEKISEFTTCARYEVISLWVESLLWKPNRQVDFVSKPATPLDTEYYNCANSLEKYVNTKLRDHGLITQT